MPQKSLERKIRRMSNAESNWHAQPSVVTNQFYVRTIFRLPLTLWGRVTHICVSELTIIGSDNGLSPGRRQAIIWTSAGILLIGPLGKIRTANEQCNDPMSTSPVSGTRAMGEDTGPGRKCNHDVIMKSKDWSMHCTGYMGTDKPCVGIRLWIVTFMIELRIYVYSNQNFIYEHKRP